MKCKHTEGNQPESFFFVRGENLDGIGSEVKTQSVPDELLSIFLFLVMGRNDGVDHLTFNPWRRQQSSGIASALIATGGVMGVAGGITGNAVGGVSAAGRRYSRQLDMIMSQQRRKSDSAARRSTAAAAASASAVSVMAIHAAMGVGNSTTTSVKNIKSSGIYDDQNNCFNFEPDSLLFDHFNKQQPSSIGGYRRDSRLTRGDVCSRQRDSVTGSSFAAEPRIRRKKIVSAFIIAGVGLVVLSILLVTVVLKMLPSVDSEEDLSRKNHSAINDRKENDNTYMSDNSGLYKVLQIDNNKNYTGWPTSPE
ncbi:hypothetical protein CHUAL_005501 [Chamberlinius hualienensis]